MSASAAVLYPAPPGMAASADFRLWIDGRESFVYGWRGTGYVICSLGGPAQVEIETQFDFEAVTVRPLRHGIEPAVDGRRLRFDLDGPARLSIEFDGDISRPLFLFAAPPEVDPPSPGDTNVRYFGAGKVHSPGEIVLRSDQTVYIEGGAVVRGHILAENAEGVTVRGRGILDGSIYERERGKPRPRMMAFINCRDLIVEGVTVVDSPSWTVMPLGCVDVAVRGINIMTWDMTGDGVDLVGCRDATVEDCFLRCADDCVAVKAITRRHEAGGNNVENIRVRRCVCWNAHPGNGLEIGYETRCDSMSDIVFEDCDIIRVEHEGFQSGGTFTIHNGDRAVVSNVRYENIRIEDSRQKLIDIKVLFSRYSRDEQRGQVLGVRFKDISVVGGPFPVSIIQGHDGEHVIEDVTIENLVVHGRRIASANEARMVVEVARGVRFI